MAPQGTPKRPQPKDKHKKNSWIKRDAARKAKQEAHAQESTCPTSDTTNA
jgi:hypothetical protein